MPIRPLFFCAYYPNLVLPISGSVVVHAPFFVIFSDTVTIYATFQE